MNNNQIIQYEQFDQYDDQHEQLDHEVIEHEADDTVGSNLYLEYQQEFCSYLYSPYAFECRSWESFVSFIQRKPKSKRHKLELNSIRIHNFCKTFGLKKKTSTVLIKMIKELSGNQDVPSGLKQV
jgi:hypothetical protein